MNFVNVNVGDEPSPAPVDARGGAVSIYTLDEIDAMIAARAPTMALVTSDGKIAQTTDFELAVVRNSTGVYTVSSPNFPPMGRYHVLVTVADQHAFYGTWEPLDGGLAFNVTTWNNATAGAADSHFSVTVTPIVGGTSIYFAGDSETEGNTAVPNDSIGGSRVIVVPLLRAAGKNIVTVGQYFIDHGPQGGYHRGIAGEALYTVVASGMAALTSFMEAAQPDIAVFGWGVNDMAGARTPAQIQADYVTVLAACRAVSPDTIFCIESIIKPGAGAAGGYSTYRAQADVYNAGLAAFCTANGCVKIDRGAPTLGADQIHPVNGAAGYTAIGNAEYAVLLPLVP